MTKRELIDTIIGMNATARPAFLAQFSDDDLNEYLEHLRMAARPRPTQSRRGWASNTPRSTGLPAIGRPAAAPARLAGLGVARPVRPMALSAGVADDPALPAAMDDIPTAPAGQYVPTARPDQPVATEAQPLLADEVRTASGVQEPFLF